MGSHLPSGPSNTGRLTDVGFAASLSRRCAGWSWSWLVPLRDTEVRISKLTSLSGLGYTRGVCFAAGSVTS